MTEQDRAATSVRRPAGRRRVATTLVAAVVAFALGVGISLLLRHRDLERRDRRALTALEQELAVFPAPIGATSEVAERGELCCRDGKCPPPLSRSDLLATGTDAAAFYSTAFEREGWTRDTYSEPGRDYYLKDVAGRRARASLSGIDTGTVRLGFHLEAESC